MKKRKLRPIGDVTQDLEPLYQEMAWDHKLQHHEMLGIQYAYLRSHLEDAMERYVDGTLPVYFYGHEEDLIALADKIKKRRQKG